MADFVIVPDNHRFKIEVKVKAESIVQAAFEFMLLMGEPINTANLFPGDDFCTVKIGDNAYHVVKV